MDNIIFLDKKAFKMSKNKNLIQLKHVSDLIKEKII